MEKPKIDFLKEKYHLSQPKKQHLLFLGRTLAVVIVVTATVGATLSYHVARTGNSVENFPKLSLFSTIRHFVEGDKLKGEDSDRVNILLLGIGGEGHEGPELTDTIIFASYQPSSGKIGLMSLPRDMSVPIPGYGYRKVNSANSYGEMNRAGDGPNLASNVIGQILNEPIQYYIRVDFSGFGKLIDDIGGIDVYVDHAFTDPDYPVLGRENDPCGNEDPHSGTVPTTSTSTPEVKTKIAAPNYSCRFETLVFQEGWKHMDGATALKFVRSRHGTNGEGSDFARSARQQKVLLGIKNKVFSVSTFVNPVRITRILEALQANIATNLSTSEILRLAQAAKKLDESQVTHHVIDASLDSPLYAASVNGAYVLLPKNDDWKPLQQIAAQIFTQKVDQEHLSKTPGEKPHSVTIEIQNGTTRTGLAFAASQLLDGQGFDIVKVGNAASRGYTHTVIYDLTNGTHQNELKALRDFFKADVTLSATGWMVGGDVVPKELALTSDDYEKLTTGNQIDFLVILGENASSLVRN